MSLKQLSLLLIIFFVIGSVSAIGFDFPEFPDGAICGDGICDESELETEFVYCGLDCGGYDCMDYG